MTNCSQVHPNGQRPRSFNWQGLSNDDVYTDGFYTGGDDPLDMHFQWNDDPALWPEKFEKVVHAFPTDFKDLADILDTEYPVGTVPKPSKKRGHPVESEKSTPRRSSTDTYQNSLYFRRTIKQGTDRLRRSRAQHKWTIPTVQFFGFCDKVCGDLALNIAGIIHPLPAQSGVPEWSRITMVSYETPQSGTADKGYLDADEQDLKIYMRYEGIICPGGSVMLGFYHMGDDYVDGSEDQFMKHGPFIFWNTHFKKLDEDSGDEDDGESSGSDGDHSASDSPDDIDASITDNNTSHNTTQTFDEIMTSNSIGVTSKEEEEEDDEKFWLAAVEALHADD
ncbi:MAG: hypothetical protein LQ343_004577 [Gyalolechia ehrenbergii]|nr:MAG: hypothetical protein LQ343_004577 [Gyalolechia ehrenbergii]